MIVNGEYHLITTDSYFLAPDGEEYRSAWGRCFIIEAKEAFGFVPLRPSTNWFCRVGDGENSIIIAGCQIHYAVQCETKPFKRPERYNHETTQVPIVANKIYFAE
jgi:hypothetical protein